MLFSAINANKKRKYALEYFIASWGMAAGGIFLSWLGQLNYYTRDIVDPGIFSSLLVLGVKTLLLIYVLTGMQYSIKANEFSKTKSAEN